MMKNNITMTDGYEVCINTTGDCSKCMIPKVGTCNHDRYHDYLNKKGGNNDINTFVSTNNITMMTNNNRNFDYPFDDESKDVFNVTLHVNKKALEGLTYEQILAVITMEISEKLVVAPSKRTFYPQGFYNINPKSKVQEAIIEPDRLCLVMENNPFEPTDEDNIGPYGVVIEAGEYMGPED